MRIAYALLDPGIGVFGTKGASVHVQEVVRALRADGHDVTVFCTRLDGHVPADLADLDVRRYRLPRSSGAERERAVVRAAAEVAAQIAAGGFDLVYERYSLFADTIALLARAVPEVPAILEVNAPLVEEQLRHRELADVDAAIEATRRQIAAARLVSCVSEPVARWAREQGADPARVVVTPNGVNTTRITPRTDVTNDDGDGAGAGAGAGVTVGFVGTLKPWHGTDVLLRALARTDERLALDLCGAGPEQDNLERLAGEFGIAGRVRLRGAVAPELVPEILRGSDIAVAPYPPGDHYFSPLKVYEYLAAGLPVVASAIGSLPELLGHGELGVLVEPGDVDALAEALGTLADDPVRRTELGHRAREAAVHEHDWRRRCRDLLARVDLPASADLLTGVRA